jgi:glycosyltransferase involved in cell wall biosynthesis
MIKVLLLGPSFVLKGGVTNYLEHLIQNLNKEQIQVKYFAHGISPKAWKNIFLPFIIILQFVKIKKILEEFKPDIVHINPSLIIGAIFRDFLFLTIIKIYGYPVLFFIHGWQENISNKFQYIFWKHFFKKRFDKAEAIVVLAKQFKEKLIDLGINADKIYVSSTMVESEKYLPEDKNFSRPYKILFCANMNKEKGPFEILEAAPIVLRKFPNTKFIFVGKGKDLEKLKNKSKEIGIDKNVDFTGYITLEEKIRIFKKSHVFVFPSSHGEGFPTVILEAMAAGLPIVTTAKAGLRDAIENGKQGLVIDSMPPTPREISAKMIQLIKNKKVMKKMSENNLAEVKDKYDVDVVSKQIEEIYQDIIN